MRSLADSLSVAISRMKASKFLAHSACASRAPPVANRIQATHYTHYTHFTHYTPYTHPYTPYTPYPPLHPPHTPYTPYTHREPTC